MKIAFFDSRSYDIAAFKAQNQRFGFELTFFEARLTSQTAGLAAGYEVVCSFVNDRVDEPALETMKRGGLGLLALRSAGYNHVDLAAAERLGLPVVRVPEYSPHAVAEHTVGLVLTLNRRLHKAYARVREGNFSLEGLIGFDMFGKTCGLIGVGRIGTVTAKIFRGFGCRVLVYDKREDPQLAAELGFNYVDLATLYRESDIVSLHVPLVPDTHHLIDQRAFDQMKDGVMLVNTSRGALVDTRALIVALKTGKLAAAALDVYEEEEGIFFEDLSDQVLHDDVLARLLTFPNVLVTAHQGFLTREALANIAETTLANVAAFARGEALDNEVRLEQHRPGSSAEATGAA